MTKKPPDPFDSATYYSYAEEEERLTHETPEDAIEYLVDMQHTTLMNVTEAIAALGYITIYAWRRRVVSEKWIEGATRSLVDFFDELYSDEYGEEGPMLSFSGKKRTSLGVMLEKVVRRGIKLSPPYQCDTVAAREYTSVEVLRLMQKQRPDWFKK